MDNHVGNFDILSPRQFFLDFEQHAQVAKKRVYAQTMYIEPGWALSTVTNALIGAKNRGADAELKFDYYSFMIVGQQLAWVPTFGQKRYEFKKPAIEAKKGVISELESFGVRVKITNPPNLLERVLPFIGRNHIKMAIVDDVAWVGGVSYRDDDLGKEDFMMRFTDPNIVTVLLNAYNMLNENDLMQDIQFRCDEDTVIIVDGGHPRRSKILDNALSLIKEAESSVKIVSQYSISGKTGKILSQTYKRKTDVKTFVSDNKSIAEWFGKVLDFANVWITRLLNKQVPTLRSKNRIHAKALLVDTEIEGRTVGMIGSHNLVNTGVLLGTEELCVFSTHPVFVHNLQQYFQSLENRVLNQ